MLEEIRLFSPHSIADLASGWLVHAHKARDRHDLASRKYATGQYALGIPSLIASTVVGTSVFSSVAAKQVPEFWVVLLSITAAVLAAIQTFMDFGGRSDKHRLAAVRYKEAIRRLEYLGVKLANQENVSDEQISTVKAELDGLEESAPVVMARIYDRVEAKYKNVKYVRDALDLYNT